MDTHPVVARVFFEFFIHREVFEIIHVRLRAVVVTDWPFCVKLRSHRIHRTFSPRRIDAPPPPPCHRPQLIIAWLFRGVRAHSAPRCSRSRASCTESKWNMTRRAPGSRMLGMRPRRTASRKLRSQRGTCRDNSAKSINLGGEALWSGGSAVAAAVFSAGPAISVVFITLARCLAAAVSWKGQNQGKPIEMGIMMSPRTSDERLTVVRVAAGSKALRIAVLATPQQRGHQSPSDRSLESPLCS